MVKFYDSLSDDLRDWALAQQVFFIASAPRFGKHVNVSPKGLPAATFTVLGPNAACYIDATGSGAETISHIYDTGRATVMFCSFDKAPRIMRLFCTGRVVEYDQPEFQVLLKRMGKEHVTGARAVIQLSIFKVQTSCGFGVPLLSDVSTSDVTSADAKPRSQLLDRETLGHWAETVVKKGQIEEYRAINNAHNLDGLPALKAARRSSGEVLWVGDMRAYLMKLLRQWDAVMVGTLLALLVMLAVNMASRSGVTWFSGKLIVTSDAAGT